MKRWIMWSNAGAVAVAAILAGLMFLPGSDPPPDAEADAQETTSSSDHLEKQARLAELGYDVHTDSDGDGLADVMENFVYGSDPEAFSTTGNGIPDGWFALYGHDPTVAGVESKPAAIPPKEALPDVYNGYWPDKYRWSLGDVYTYGLSDDNGTFHDNGIDPNQWAAPSGLPMAWLVHHAPADDDDWNVTDSGLAEKRRTDDDFTVRDNYEHDTDPLRPDTDGDGLTDALEVQRYGTDPTKFSSSGTGIPDGWLVLHQLDPLDTHIGPLDVSGKGMGVIDVWDYNVDRFGTEDARSGTGLSPKEMSHRGDGIPDGWLLQYGLDPMRDGVASEETRCAYDYAHVRNVTGSGDARALPELCLTVAQAYAHGRPPAWDEKDNGPWPGGLDPEDGDQDGDGLPDAVEIRGWYIQHFVDVGPNAKGTWIHVRSDPLRADTDDDGLGDLDEYLGETEQEGKTYHFDPSDPSNPDTAFSGMTDAQKVFGTYGGQAFDLHEEMDGGGLRPLLDPARRDTAGDFLADGQAMALWSEAEQNVQARVAYNTIYPGSQHDTYLDWMAKLDWFDVELTGDAAWDAAAALVGPDGDVDNDLIPNVVDSAAAGDGVLNGWKVEPQTLRFSDMPPASEDRPRAVLDPANPDTDGDELPDAWELQHGRWSDTLGGWDLDPGHWNSNGDGETSDAKGNIDGDEVLWHAYRDGKPVEDHWEYTNEREYDAGTDPRLKDQDNNNVTEGWVAFWTEVYPEWLNAVGSPNPPPQDLGDVLPDPQQVDALRDEIGNPSIDVGGRAKDQLDYFRYAQSVEDNFDSTFLDPNNDEDFLEDWVVEEIQKAGGKGSAYIAIIVGTFEHTHAHDQEWGLNPYLKDTSGDDLRDAWGAYYAQQESCVDAIHPAQRIADEDPDGDGLSNSREYDFGKGIGKSTWTAGDGGLHPCTKDTDMDGMPDKDEIFLPQRDPLTPQGASEGQGDGDTDEDGLTDSFELDIGTDPTAPDSDRDGLLDGLNLPEEGTSISSDQVSGLKALGIAHRDPCSQDTSEICFFGEETHHQPAYPLDAHIRIPGVPDGWSVYYGYNDGGSAEFNRYTCGMPNWWDQQQLGVWWWGLGLGESKCPRDRDRDGLDDRNGEDPVPAASQTNHAASTDLQDLMAAASGPSLDLVRSAQTWGECAGDPGPCFTQWDREDGLSPRSDVEITGLELEQDGADVTEIGKEGPFTVSGRLEACEDTTCVGAPNRTVLVRLAGDDALQYDALGDDFNKNGVTLGVAFTEENGDFTIDGCLCAGGGTIGVPEGFTALGRSNTTAAWDPQAAKIPVGSQWTLGVHAYASTATFWGDDRQNDTHPQYLELVGAPTATESLWYPWGDLNVTSSTAIAIGDSMPDQIAWGDGRVLPVTVQLLDESGGAVDGQDVSITVTGASSSLAATRITDQGKVAVEFDLGDRTGTWNVKASYGGDADLGLEASDSEIVAITLQAPLTLTTSADEPIVRLGEPTAFMVTAASQETLVEGLEVTASLGATKKAALTDEHGLATISITPSGMDPGAATVTFSASSTDEYASASVTQGVTLVSSSLLQANLPDAGNLGAPLFLSGCLTLTDGTALDGKTVDATLAGETLGEPFSTDDEGCFSGAPVVPLDLGIGVHKLRLTYEGETDAVDAATVEEPVRFSVGTRLGLDEIQAGRGQGASLSGRLTSITGTPLVGEEVNITLPWNDTISVLARSGGNFSKEVAIPTDHALGVFQVNASYDGSTNGTYGASKIQALLEIGSPSRIEAGPLGILHRGNNTVTGHLRDDETGDPIADATIHATPSTGEPLTLQTDDEGRFRFSLSLARDIPGGDINVAFHYAGDAGYAPAQNTSHGILRVPARLSIAMPIELGRGTSHDIDVRLTDDRGAPLSTRNVTLSALDATWNATTDTDGNARFALDVPLDTDLGATRISAAYAGDAAHDVAQATREATVKDGVHVNIDGMPDEVLPGQRVTLNIHVEDTSGRPVQTPVLVRIDGVPGSLLVETDDLGRAQAPIVVPDTGTEALRVTVRFPGTDVLAARTESMEPTLGVATQAAAPTTGWPWMATAAIAAILVAATAAFLLLRRRRSDATDILQDTEKRITAGDPWADAVLDAYRRLVELVRSYGIEDDESQTGRAFAQTLVDAGFLHERAARELVALFERARYAGDTMDPADADEARRVLQSTLGSVQRTEAHRGGTPA